MKLHKLHQKGFGHWLVLAIIVVGVAAVGTYVLVVSHAATSDVITSQPAQAATDLNRINNYRSGKGFYAYAHRTCLDTVAQHHAYAEAQQYPSFTEPSDTWLINQIHTYCSASNSSSRTLLKGMNDERYISESADWTQLVNSCPHLRNIAMHGADNSSFSLKTPNGTACGTQTAYHFLYDGTGVYTKGGYTYVTQVFAEW